MTDASMEILMLPVPLTESEKNTRAREMAQLMTELERAEIAETIRKKLAAEAIKTLEAKVRDLRVVVHSGLEDRPVECDVIFEFDSGTVKHVRRDTGETASSRAMTEKEKESARQASLWGPNAPTIKVSPGAVLTGAWWTPREASEPRDAYDELLGQAHREESAEAAPVWWPSTLKGLWRLPDPEAREFGVGDMVAVVEDLGGESIHTVNALARRLGYRPAEMRVMLALLRNAGVVRPVGAPEDMSWELVPPSVDEVQARRLAESAVASSCPRAKGLANWPDAIAAAEWLFGGKDGLRVDPDDMNQLWFALAKEGEHPWLQRPTDAWTPTEAVAVAMVLEKHGLLEHVGNLEFRALQPAKSSPPKAGRNDSLPQASKPAKPKVGPKASTVKAVDKALDGGP